MEVIAESELEKQKTTEVFPVEMDKAVEEEDKYDLQFEEGHSEEAELAGSQAPQAPKGTAVKRPEEESKEVRPHYRLEEAQEARPHYKLEEEEAQEARPHYRLEEEEAQEARPHYRLEEDEAQEARPHYRPEEEEARPHYSLEEDEAQEARPQYRLEEEEVQEARPQYRLEEDEAPEARPQYRLEEDEAPEARPQYGLEEGSKEAWPHDGMQEGNDEELDESGLRVLWQVGDLTAKDLSMLRDSKAPRRDSGGELQGEDLDINDQELDWESSLEEQDLGASDAMYKQESSWLRGRQQEEQPFQELLSDLQQENQNLRTLCLTLTREKTHLARTVLEMREKLKGQGERSPGVYLGGSSQENLSLKLQLDALREDKRQGLKTGKAPQKIRDMTLEERAQIAEQEATQAEAQLIALRERYNRIERDNQVMADEIHNFREEVGRLRQCPVR
ncbi:uncharacterized protein LOC144490745, partial [Mustelus asterias]